MKYCEYPNCGKRIYGLSDSTQRYCVRHKLAGFNNGRSKCKHPDCKNGQYMASPVLKLLNIAHHISQPIMLMSKVNYVIPSGTTQANFGAPGTKVVQYCASHRPADYVNVKNKKCRFPGCRKQPNYGAPGTKIAQYCLSHKLANFVNINSTYRCHHRSRRTAQLTNSNYKGPHAKLRGAVALIMLSSANQ